MDAARARVRENDRHSGRHRTAICLSIYDASTAIGIPTIYMVLVLYDI